MTNPIWTKINNGTEWQSKAMIRLGSDKRETKATKKKATQEGGSTSILTQRKMEQCSRWRPHQSTFCRSVESPLSRKPKVGFMGRWRTGEMAVSDARNTLGTFDAELYESLKKNTFRHPQVSFQNIFDTHSSWFSLNFCGRGIGGKVDSKMVFIWI